MAAQNESHTLARAASRDEQASERFLMLRPTLEGGMPIARLARERGIPLRTMRRWLAAYRRDGLVGLARQPRSDRGQIKIVCPELLRLIAECAAAVPRPSAASVHRAVSAVAAEQGRPMPSYGTVYRMLRSGSHEGQPK